MMTLIPVTHRSAGMAFIEKLEALLTGNKFLFGDTRGFADIAIFPFIRQFRIADPAWFDAAPIPYVQKWLAGSDGVALVFTSVMQKYPLWKETRRSVFGFRRRKRNLFLLRHPERGSGVPQGRQGAILRQCDKPHPERKSLQQGRCHRQSRDCGISYAENNVRWFSYSRIEQHTDRAIHRRHDKHSRACLAAQTKAGNRA